ncbi:MULTISPECIES: HTH domain-containing protein [Aeromonas]|uniref:HTH domain-containing protein n=1 Tax=Aeromonas TaxID=642 RepID=UPI0009469D70|nr:MULTISPECIES: HTH domain-containing protein [Aeromonas]MDM5103844.1 HTH domain-containing protein [Aeromonas salmonicida]OLF19974.1 hypothetical protein BSP75_19600 [Aeromonas sp. YN13HZO-058]TNH83514.1 tellurium resistance protein TerW [Aeromonas sobria]TNI77413.1 tellurium resistance protein TerW [Aeromonas sobria]HEH9441803.1 HTH domain-containing protein [Aeromonas sobria]
MLLSAKQKRLYQLVLLLSSGKPVSGQTINDELGCSGATLTRTFRELREGFDVVIKFSKSNNSYQITEFGDLTKSHMVQLAAALEKSNELQTTEATDVVVDLKKPKKKAVTVSLSVTAIRKLDRVTAKLNLNRSDTLDKLVRLHIDKL